jgi:hypothetical protein
MLFVPLPEMKRFQLVNEHAAFLPFEVLSQDSGDWRERRFRLRRLNIWRYFSSGRRYTLVSEIERCDCNSTDNDQRLRWDRHRPTRGMITVVPHLPTSRQHHGEGYSIGTALM